ncbi:hypothetical protein [Leptolyngbya ohadii]|nr:hypothetical protein [Leptolyngbya ohadii]
MLPSGHHLCQNPILPEGMRSFVGLTLAIQFCHLNFCHAGCDRSGGGLAE